MQSAFVGRERGPPLLTASGTESSDRYHCVTTSGREALASTTEKVILDARTLAVVKMTFGVSLVAANDVIERALPALQQHLLC